MKLLSRCCCCFHLKYGYFAYGILSMAARLMAAFSLYQTTKLSFDLDVGTSGQQNAEILIAQTMSLYGGWIITGIVCLFLTLQGIVQKRSILLYPYIVVLSVELCGIMISCLILSMVATPIFLLMLPFGAGIIGYELWCLISLYKQMKHKEQARYLGEAIPFKAV